MATPKQQWVQALIDERAAFESALGHRHQATAAAVETAYDYEELKDWDHAAEHASILAALSKYAYAFGFVDTNEGMIYASADPLIYPLYPHVAPPQRADLYQKWRQEAQQRITTKKTADVGQAGNLPETPQLGGGGSSGGFQGGGGGYPPLIPIPGGGGGGGGPTPAPPAEPGGAPALLLLAGGAALVYAVVRLLRR